MSSLSERMYVTCPFGKAPTFLSLYLDELARADGKGATLRLSLPLAALGIPSGVNLQRDVIARFEPAAGKYGLERVGISWQPEGGGPFPTFSGFLSVEQDERYGSSSLLLEGSYEPPLGLVGKAFDVAVGGRIAHATAHELLSAVRRRIEADWSAALAQPVN